MCAGGIFIGTQAVSFGESDVSQTHERIQAWPIVSESTPRRLIYTHHSMTIASPRMRLNQQELASILSGFGDAEEED